MPKRIALIAIGGNSLILDKGLKSFEDQYEAVYSTCIEIASLIRDGWEVAVTHGNGPQVGFILRRSEHSLHDLYNVPLVEAHAQSQGSIGYIFQQNLLNIFKEMGILKSVVSIITQVEVDINDEAFQKPSKPVGSFVAEETAQDRIAHGEDFVEDIGRGWRRVVSSPSPKRVVESNVIKRLIDMGSVIIAAGGGGIPVIVSQDGKYRGVEAVIDKDLSAALLAIEIGAELLLISTAVEKIAIHFNKPNQAWLDHITLAEAEKYIKEGHFAPGSMLPKIQAAIHYLKNGGKKVVITSPSSIERAISGDTGTHLTK